LFENGESKAVSSANGCACTEVLLRRLRERGWDFVLFHGGVPAQGKTSWTASVTIPSAGFPGDRSGGVGLNCNLLPW